MNTYRTISNAQQILRNDYEFRYNVVSSAYDYKNLAAGRASWEHVTDSTIAEVKYRLYVQGISISRRMVGDIVKQSAFQYDPVADYRKGLASWNNYDHLGDVVSAIELTDLNDEPRLRDFLARMLAHVLYQKPFGRGLLFVGYDPMETCLWARNLLPEGLRSIYYEQVQSVKGIDEIVAHRLLIALPYFGNKSVLAQRKVDNVLTSPLTNVPSGSGIAVQQRAIIVAGVETGNLPKRPLQNFTRFEIDGIDDWKMFNIDGVYAQVKEMVETGLITL